VNAALNLQVPKAMELVNTMQVITGGGEGRGAFRGMYTVIVTCEQ